MNLKKNDPSFLRGCADDNLRKLRIFDNWSESNNGPNNLLLEDCNQDPDPIIIHCSTKGIRGINFNLKNDVEVVLIKDP